MADNLFPRLSRTEFIIMNLLIGPREKYGLELVEKSNGALKRGTIYVTLGRLEDKGFIHSRKEPQTPGGAAPRRLYKPTGVGTRVFRALDGAGGKAWLQREGLA